MFHYQEYITKHPLLNTIHYKNNEVICSRGLTRSVRGTVCYVILLPRKYITGHTLVNTIMV